MKNFFLSSIGKKITMGLAGLFLCLFLVVHLSVNLLMVKNDGGQMYMKACSFMRSNLIIKGIEIVLFGGIFLHMLYGIILQIQNWFARPERYYATPATKTSFFSKYMIHTGLVILSFLIFHFFHFFFVKTGLVSPPEGPAIVNGPHDFYHMAVNLFRQPFYSWTYILFILFMGFHLGHALQSAFQTLGVGGPRISAVLKVVGWIYAVGITAGFIIIPVYFMYFY